MIVLTGGAGFIGSNITADLNAAGHTDIVIADVLGSDNKWRNTAKRRMADIIAPDEIEPFLSGRNGVSAVVHVGANSSTTATDADQSNLLAIHAPLGVVHTHSHPSGLRLLGGVRNI
jgi:ADP-L-glycero-D-manno-heptose 6-epimerase